MATVYLLHIEPAWHHMQHYLGATDRNVVIRFHEHQNGLGSRLTKQALAAGSRLILARVWENVPWEFERKLKGRSIKLMCPICSPPKGGRVNQEGGSLPAAGG